MLKTKLEEQSKNEKENLEKRVKQLEVELQEDNKEYTKNINKRIT